MADISAAPAPPLVSSAGFATTAGNSAAATSDTSVNCIGATSAC